MVSDKQKFYNIQKNNNSNIIQTSNNVTYVSIKYDDDQQQFIKQKQQQFNIQNKPNTFFEEKKKLNLMPYCPTPDYDTSSDENQDNSDSINHLTNEKKITQSVEIQRLQNTNDLFKKNNQKKPISHNNSFNVINNVYQSQNRKNLQYDNKEQQQTADQSYILTKFSDKQKQQQQHQQHLFYDKQQLQQFTKYKNSHQLPKISQPLNRNQNNYSNNSLLESKYHYSNTNIGVNSFCYDNKKFHLPDHSYLAQQKNMICSRWYYDKQNDNNNQCKSEIKPVLKNHYLVSNKTEKSSQHQQQQHYSHMTLQCNQSPPLPSSMPIKSKDHQKQQYHSHNQFSKNDKTIIRRF